jgi:putative exporter of polyketide antibiotics
MVEKKNHSYFLKVVLLFWIIGLLIITYVIFIAKFPIDYTNGNAVNSTIAENNARTMIQAQSVPTVINGIIASTSIIITFSGVIIGLIYREVLQNDNKLKELLIAFTVLFIFSFGYMFYAYNSLATGGQDFLSNSWRSAWLGFTYSLFLLMFIFLFIAFSMKAKKSIEEKLLDDKKAEQQESNKEIENKPK